MASSPTEPTGCEKCCAPGGDCSHAFKGSPGKCCGIREGVSYCCPGEAYRGYQSGDAKCYDCGEVYRCFVGSNQGQICGAGTPVGGSSGAILFFLALALVFVLIVFLLFLLLRLMRRHSYVVIGTPAPGYHPEVKPGYPGACGSTAPGSVAVGRLTEPPVVRTGTARAGFVLPPLSAAADSNRRSDGMRVSAHPGGRI